MDGGGDEGDEEGYEWRGGVERGKRCGGGGGRGGGCGLLETASGVFVMQAAAGAQKCFAEGEDMSGFSSDVVKRDQDHKKKV